MKYHLTEIYDFNELQSLCESFTKVSGVVTAILDLEGNVHVATGWQPICTKFHRVHPDTAALCTESDTVLAGQLKSGMKYNVYKCKNGLMDVAMPIIVDGYHVGNFFTGQFFTEEPDIEFFRNQAKKYGFNENEYLDALANVPVFSEEQIKVNLTFLVQLTEIVGNIGLKNLVSVEHGQRQEFEKEALKKINQEYEQLNKEYIEVNKELVDAKLKVQESEETYRMLYECINDALFTSELCEDGTLGKFVMVNDVACKRLGYTEQELLSKSSEDIISEKAKSEFKQQINKILANKHVVLEIEHVTKDGRIIPTEISTNIARIRDKIVLHTIARDITVRKESENKIRTLNSELEQRVSERTEELNNKNADLENVIAKLQATQSQLILFEKMTVLRHLIAGIAHEINNPLGAIDSSRELLEVSIKTLVGAVEKISKWLHEKEGDLLAEMIDMATCNVDSVMNVSFSEKRKLRAKVVELLEENSVVETDDIGNILVELGLGEDLVRFMPLLQSDDIFKKLVAVRCVRDSYLACYTIKTAVSKSAKIVNALRGYVRKGAGTENKVLANVREGLDNVLVLFQNTFKVFVKLELEIDDDLPEVMCYPDQLNQVWTNIIQNALYAMEGSGTLKIKVESKDRGVLVSVIDHGCGMTPEVKARIFEPLFTTKPAGEGIGLGMDIVHMIITERHGGRIDVESEPGKGTTVSIFLPAE